MMLLPSGVWIHIALGITDLRKRLDGLPESGSAPPALGLGHWGRRGSWRGLTEKVDLR